MEKEIKVQMSDLKIHTSLNCFHFRERECVGFFFFRVGLDEIRDMSPLLSKNILHLSLSFLLIAKLGESLGHKKNR